MNTGASARPSTESPSASPADRPTVEYTTTSNHRGLKIAFAALSIIVLGLLLAICLGTVRSIVEPIRRLIRNDGQACQRRRRRPRLARRDP